jgi:hypothetical protein
VVDSVTVFHLNFVSAVAHSSYSILAVFFGGSTSKISMDIYERITFCGPDILPNVNTA